jgi:RimJ/RimL family protein N-acetyltransferase
MLIKQLDKFGLLTGSYVTLTKLSKEDSKFCVELRNSDRAKFLNPGADSISTQDLWLANRPSNELNYVIRDENEVRIGLISLIDIDFNNLRAEPARFITEEVKTKKNSKYVFESLLLIYNLAFRELGLQKIYGVIAKSNNRMINLQITLGMDIEGTLKRHNKIDGKFEDLVMLSLFSQKFEEHSYPLLQKFLYR